MSEQNGSPKPASETRRNGRALGRGHGPNASFADHAKREAGHDVPDDHDFGDGLYGRIRLWLVDHPNLEQAGRVIVRRSRRALQIARIVKYRGINRIRYLIAQFIYRCRLAKYRLVILKSKVRNAFWNRRILMIGSSAV